MKGPGLRLDLDVRRMWRCPRCGRERRADASVTALTCGCAPDHPRMQLVEIQRRVRPEPKPLDLVLNIDLDAPEEESRDESPDPVVIASEPMPASPDVTSDRAAFETGRGARRRKGNRNEAPSMPATPSDAVVDAAVSEPNAVEQTTVEDARADDADDFGAGLSDAPSPSVPEDPGV